MTTHIFKSESQPIHRLTKYWYTVESKGPYYKRARVIYSNSAFAGARRKYRVRVNDDTGNPQIVKSSARWSRQLALTPDHRE